MTAALLGLATGLAAGTVMARHGLCFNRGVRQAVFERRATVLRAFAVAVAIQLLVLPVLVALGTEPLAGAAAAGGPPLLPAAELVGGLVFGAGMALAGGCITGMLWKAGGGAAALAIAIVGFVAGELTIRGPADGLLRSLDDASRPSERSLATLVGVDYQLIAVVLGVVGLAALVVRRRDGVAAGAALGAIAAAAWLAADGAGYGYGLGFVGAAEGTRGAIATGAALPFQLWLALGVVGGGAIGARGGLRLPDRARAARAAAGGVLMGVGGTLAHGCNIGHGVTGLPLLSLGSGLAIIAMSVGALVTWRLVLAGHPRRRGSEHRQTTVPALRGHMRT